MLDQIIITYVLNGNQFVEAFLRTDPRVKFLMDALFANPRVCQITTRVFSR